MINKTVEWPDDYDEEIIHNGTLIQFATRASSAGSQNIIVGIVLMDHGMFVDVPFQNLKVTDMMV
jgi:hypothetical protein